MAASSSAKRRPPPSLVLRASQEEDEARAPRAAPGLDEYQTSSRLPASRDTVINLSASITSRSGRVRENATRHAVPADAVRARSELALDEHRHVPDLSSSRDTVLNLRKASAGRENGAARSSAETMRVQRQQLELDESRTTEWRASSDTVINLSASMGARASREKGVLYAEPARHARHLVAPGGLVGDSVVILGASINSRSGGGKGAAKASATSPPAELARSIGSRGSGGARSAGGGSAGGHLRKGHVPLGASMPTRLPAKPRGAGPQRQLTRVRLPPPSGMAGGPMPRIAISVRPAPDPRCGLSDSCSSGHSAVSALHQPAQQTLIAKPGAAVTPGGVFAGANGYKSAEEAHLPYAEAALTGGSALEEVDELLLRVRSNALTRQEAAQRLRVQVLPEMAEEGGGSPYADEWGGDARASRGSMHAGPAPLDRAGSNDRRAYLEAPQSNACGSGSGGHAGGSGPHGRRAAGGDEEHWADSDVSLAPSLAPSPRPRPRRAAPTAPPPPDESALERCIRKLRTLEGRSVRLTLSLKLLDPSRRAADGEEGCFVVEAYSKESALVITANGHSSEDAELLSLFLLRQLAHEAVGAADGAARGSPQPQPHAPSPHSQLASPAASLAQRSHFSSGGRSVRSSVHSIVGADESSPVGATGTPAPGAPPHSAGGPQKSRSVRVSAAQMVSLIELDGLLRTPLPAQSGGLFLHVMLQVAFGGWDEEASWTEGNGGADGGEEAADLRGEESDDSRSEVASIASSARSAPSHDESDGGEESWGEGSEEDETVCVEASTPWDSSGAQCVLVRLNAKLSTAAATAELIRLLALPQDETQEVCALACAKGGVPGLLSVLLAPGRAAQLAFRPMVGSSTVCVNVRDLRNAETGRARLRVTTAVGEQLELRFMRTADAADALDWIVRTAAAIAHPLALGRPARQSEAPITPTTPSPGWRKGYGAKRAVAIAPEGANTVSVEARSLATHPTSGGAPIITPRRGGSGWPSFLHF